MSTTGDGKGAAEVKGDAVRVGTFAVDATPAVGDPVAYGKAADVTDPLSCRGVVLLADGPPIVLTTLDWIGTYNGGHDEWRLALAEAVDTSPERVAVHCVHQHEAPGFDSDAQSMLHAHGERGQAIDERFAYDVVDRACEAAREAAADATPVTHVGTGTGEVERVASNRQVLGPDGTVKHVRYSSETDPDSRAAHEGVVDPRLYAVSFWNAEEPVALLTYYACHPQSFYGDRRVTCDFPGLARNAFAEEADIFQVHFCGAAGNVAAGKYNDGSEENRPVLAERVEGGMRRAWEATERTPLSAEDVAWGVRRVALPPADSLDEADLVASLREEPDQRTARRLAWLDRCGRGHEIPVPRLEVGPASVLHAPGELFVEYQLAARQWRPDRLVTVAAYGDGGPGYIGTRAAYPMGGYEVGDPSCVDPAAEEALVAAFRDLLDAPDGRNVTPSDITEAKPRLPE